MTGVLNGSLLDLSVYNKLLLCICVYSVAASSTICVMTRIILLLHTFLESSMEYGQLRRPGKLMIKNKTLGGIDTSHITSSHRRRTLRVQTEKLKTHTGTIKV